MLPDKMTISYSNHLFVPAAFVFCLLSSLVHVSDSYDYTDLRQFKKNLAVSKHRNNTQWLPNYNGKPPDKYYGPRKESTGKKAGMEFTKPEDPEQRVADSWVKKMQEISRQEREKWAPYKRNKRGIRALDNVEETTKASKLTNDESITILISSKSEESGENMEEKSENLEKLFEGSGESSEANIDSVFSEIPVQQLPLDERSANVKNLRNSTRLNTRQSTDTNGLSNKKFSDSRWGMSVKNPPAGFLREASVAVTHQRRKKDETSETAENSEKQSAIRDYEKSELQKDPKESPRSSQINSHPGKSISQRPKNRNTAKKLMNTHKNIKKISKNSDDSGRRSYRFEKLPAKVYDRQSSPSRDDSEENGEESRENDEKIVKANSLMRKREEDDMRRKDTTGKPLNHEGSFHPGRWGMSVSSPPAEFLRDVSRRSIHRENKERIEDEKDGEDHQTSRWGMSISSPPKEFLQDISTHRGHGTGRSAVKIRSRPGEFKGSSADRSPPVQSRRNLQTNLVEQLMIDERNEESPRTLVGTYPGGPINTGDRGLNAWSNYPDVDLYDKIFLRNIKFLMQVFRPKFDLRSNIIDVPILCRARIPIDLFRA